MMPLYAALVAATVLACEVGFRLPFGRLAGSLNHAAWRSMEVIGSRAISDHWKERMLPVYAMRILKTSVGLFLCLVAIAATAVLVVLPVTGSVAAASTAMLALWPLVTMTAVGMAYVGLRQRVTRTPSGAGASPEHAPPDMSSDHAAPDMSSDYSALDKTLHKVILGNPMLSQPLPAIDARVSRGALPAERPVYVTGLARAGTTVLMRALHGSDQFASLTYADMPFVLAPNLWAVMSRRSRKRREGRERAHGDGVIVDFDAPEALEEVFWRTECGSDYIHNNALVPHRPGPEVIARYRDYQARICHRHGRRRYLAKNNNMMLRLDTLAESMPDARFLVPVRDPLSQARSLLRQHRRFVDADSFTRDYMRWLVHHEFGPDQRPYHLPDGPRPGGARGGLSYWLTQWVACYGYLADVVDRHPGQVRPVIYETLGHDAGAWSRVAAFVDVPVATSVVFAPAPVPDADGLDVDPSLVARARELYARLQAPMPERRSHRATGPTPRILAPSLG